MALCGVKTDNPFFLKYIIQDGSINVVYKCILKKDARVFHHIVHRLNVYAGILDQNEESFI